MMTTDDALASLLSRCTSLAYRLLPDADIAREVVAEAVTRLLEHQEVLDGDPDRVTAWTLRVTRNLAIDVVRRRARERELDGIELACVDFESEIVLRLAVLDAIGELPERQRRVIALRYLLDHSQAEVATDLGVGLGTVATHVHRALRWLRASLADAPIPPTRRDDQPMKITPADQAAGLIGTDHTVSTRITGRSGRRGFAVDIGIPAIYYGRGQLRGPRWGRSSPDTIIGTVLDCVVIDLDDDRVPVVTDALSGNSAARFDQAQSQIGELRPGDQRHGRVGVVLSFGSFVEFDGLRGLVNSSDIDPTEPLHTGQEVDVEIVDTNPGLGRISLRIPDPR